MIPFCFYERYFMLDHIKNQTANFLFCFFHVHLLGLGSHSSTAVSKSIDRRSILAKKSPQAQWVWFLPRWKLRRSAKIAWAAMAREARVCHLQQKAKSAARIIIWKKYLLRIDDTVTKENHNCDFLSHQKPTKPALKRVSFKVRNILWFFVLCGVGNERIGRAGGSL